MSTNDQREGKWKATRAACALLVTLLFVTNSAFVPFVVHPRANVVRPMSYCWPLTDEVGAVFLARAVRMGSSTAPIYVKGRTSLALPVVAPSAIVGVTDEAKCMHVMQVIYAANLGMPSNAAIYLVAVGTHYLALAPTVGGLIVHLDDKFVIRGKVAQQ